MARIEITGRGILALSALGSPVTRHKIVLSVSGPYLSKPREVGRKADSALLRNRECPSADDGTPTTHTYRPT